MDDPEFKRKYRRCKYTVKMWEKEFKLKNRRIPSKYDIHDASQNIRDAYKMYFKLKTALLEETLSDVFSEDGFDFSLENTQEEDSPIQLPDMSLPLAVWGEEVSNKNKEEEKKIEAPVRTVKSSLSSKLFSQTSFSKRNPRKSLSRSSSVLSKTGSNLSIGSDCGRELLPDLETILLEKSQQKLKELETPTPTVSIKEKSITNDVDKRWLHRNLSEYDSGTLSEMSMVESLPPPEYSGKPSNSQSFGLSNINIGAIRQISSEIPSPQTTQPDVLKPNIPNLENDSDSVVSNSEDESPKRRFELIRPALKRRKVEIENRTAQAIEIKSVPTAVAAEQERKVESEDDTSKTKNKPTATRRGRSVKKAIVEKSDDDSPELPKSKKKEKPTVATRSKKKLKKSDSDESEFELESKIKRKRTALPKNGVRNTKTEQKKTNALEPKAKVDKPKSTTTRKTLNRSVKKKVQDNEQSNEETGSQEDAYNFLFDSNQVTSLPRININELNEAEQTLQKYIYDSGDQPTSSPAPKAKKNQSKALQTDREKLESKMASGRANENFVRINLKKKVFVRGKKTLNFSKYKKGLWKQKKAAALAGPDMDMRGCDGGILTCFSCGQPGHFAQKCPVKGDALLPLDKAAEDLSPFPTLDEAEEMAQQKALVAHSQNIKSLPQASNNLLYRDDESSANETKLIDGEFEEDENIMKETTTVATIPTKNVYIGHRIPQEFLQKAGLLDKSLNNDDKLGPLYNLKENGEMIDTPNEVYDVLKMFGHTDFRKGQDKAVMRILSGVSTLVTLSTGSGKSLCYQLPAYLYSKKKGCITLVISPLVSLMEDQVHGVPAFLNAQCLHTNQTPVQRQNVLEMINRGEVDVLLVSPEAIVAGERSTGFGSILRNLPPIAFACIDEVHCVSQWSHNFRPSYLMICKVLKTKLGVRTILGLTATATFHTRESIIRHLQIPDGVDGIITDIPLPDNLVLSVSKDENRDASLVELLRSNRLASCQSIIVYCTRRDECERVAGFIRTCLQDIKPVETAKKRKRVNWHAEPYHAGMPPYRRRTIQKAFMENDLRIVVATVAFGMGINKPDIRAVIHYNMPKNFESYVQEVGRAGRDGKISHCHLFLDAKGSDQNELRRHIYANSIDRHVIRKLLQKVFVSCSCNKNLKKKEFVDEYSEEIQAAQNIDWDECFDEHKTNRKRICSGHEIAIPTDKTVEELDIPGENIATLLCYLELDSRWSIHTLSNAYTMCKIISYGGAAYLKKAAKDCPPLAMAIALEIKNGTFDDKANVFEFSVIEISSIIGWNSGIVKYQLKNLEWTNVNDLPKRSNISVNFFELGFRIQAPGDFTDTELDSALDFLYNRSVKQEKTQLVQLQHVFDGLSSVAYKTIMQCSKKDLSIENSDRLKDIIREYFKGDFLKNAEIKIQVDTSHDEHIVQDVRAMMNMYPDNKFTGRTLARIFHGIQSPNFPALMWSRCKFWRGHFKIDFNHIVKLANKVIVEMGF